MKKCLWKNSPMYIERGFYFPINTTPCFKMSPICKKKFWEKFDKMGIMYYISSYHGEHKIDKIYGRRD
jgi:hypothetical protein